MSAQPLPETSGQRKPGASHQPIVNSMPRKRGAKSTLSRHAIRRRDEEFYPSFVSENAPESTLVSSPNPSTVRAFRVVC